MFASEYQPLAHEIVREGFEVAASHDGREAIVRVRPRKAGRVCDALQPALPTWSRIVLWGEGCGMIRDRIRPPTVWRGFVAWFMGKPPQTLEMQIEALTDELLAEIARAEEPKTGPSSAQPDPDHPAL